MPRISIGHLGVVLLGVAAVIFVALAVQSKLGWAREALELYADGTTTTPAEHELEQQALAQLQRGGDAGEIRSMLERVLAVDPNSLAVHLLGDLWLREGHAARAEAQYERYLRIDPAFLPGWLRLAELYEGQGRRAERTDLLRRGVAHYAAEVERFRPHEDDSVAAPFNSKAVAVYNGYREGLELLGTMLEEAERTAGSEARSPGSASGASPL